MEEKPPEVAPPAPVAEPLRMAAAKTFELPPAHFRFGKRTRIVFSFSANAFTLVLILMVALSLAFFVLGGRLAKPSTTPINTPRQVAKERETIRTLERQEAPKTPTGPFYAVQVITYEAGKSDLAEDLASQLKIRTGITAFTRSTPDGKFLVVYAGRFASPTEDAAVATLERIRRMTFGKTTFTDAALRRIE